jgi:hypothetical protein
MAVTLVVAMENPLEFCPVLKYSCCPDDFGYCYIRMDGDRKIVLHCDFQDTINLEDEHCQMEIRNRLFKCLLIELSYKNTPQAQQSFQSIIERLRTGRIRMSQDGDGGFTRLTRKDFFHRLLAHLPGFMDGDPIVFVSNWSVGLIFCPCIHRIESFGYRFTTSHEQYIFSNQMSQQFESIKPFPSLMALASRVIIKNHITGSVPKELESLLKR